MQDGDHQFFVSLQLTKGVMEINYFECAMPSFHFVLRIVC